MMKNLFVASILGFALAGFAGGASGAGSAAQNSNVPSQAGGLRVNSPKANERLAQNFVHVQYQLVNRGADAATSPNFTVQLDGTDPITTNQTDYTFTGLTPGTHTVTVTLVDANGVPIANASVSTKFTVVDGTHTNGTPSSSLGSPVKLQIASNEMTTLSDGSTPLPMLSLVGFAVLIGGICTAMRADNK